MLASTSCCASSSLNGDTATHETTMLSEQDPLGSAHGPDAMCLLWSTTTEAPHGHLYRVFCCLAHHEAGPGNQQ
eukprot:6046717-Amphidinium_carterae.5